MAEHQAGKIKIDKIKIELQSLFDVIMRESLTTEKEAAHALNERFPLHSTPSWAMWIKKTKRDSPNEKTEDKAYLKFLNKLCLLESDLGEIVYIDKNDYIGQCLKCIEPKPFNCACAILSFVLSTSSALSMEFKWFQLSQRGAFVMSLAVLNLLLRLLQCRYLGMKSVYTVDFV